jgi:hypothetical protein
MPYAGNLESGDFLETRGCPSSGDNQYEKGTLEAYEPDSAMPSERGGSKIRGASRIKVTDVFSPRFVTAQTGDSLGSFGCHRMRIFPALPNTFLYFSRNLGNFRKHRNRNCQLISFISASWVWLSRCMTKQQEPTNQISLEKLEVMKTSKVTNRLCGVAGSATPATSESSDKNIKTLNSALTKLFKSYPPSEKK